MQGRVLAVGDINVDLVLTGLDRLPGAEQESLARDMAVLVGGQTGTVARTLARLGWPVGFVGRVGDDENGRAALRALNEAGVDASGVVVDPAGRTGLTVVLSTGPQRAYATFAGCVAQTRRCDVTVEQVTGARHLHVGSYYLQKALRPDLPGLFREARQRGLTTSLDPGWDPSGEWGAEIRELLGEVDVFLPNAAEAAAITGTQTPEQALTALAAREGTVVVKMGAAGCVASSGGQTLRCPAFRVPVLDVTSAGDVFDAGFLHGHLSGWDLAQSLRFASACGAIAVERTGTGGIISGAEQVWEFLRGRT
jgi:sugar/nucleoside kinase (ribokinase family)